MKVMVQRSKVVGETVELEVDEMLAGIIQKYKEVDKKILEQLGSAPLDAKILMEENIDRYIQIMTRLGEKLAKDGFQVDSFTV